MERQKGEMMRIRQRAMSLTYWVGLVLLGFVLALAVLQLGLGREPVGVNVASHEYDDGDYSGSGGRYEGGQGGEDYDGDGDGNRCRNFCFYGVPYPGQPGA